MFEILEKIYRLAETKEPCRLINKMGKYFHGTIADTWARVSSGKMRGKIEFQTAEKIIQIDVNDILDIIPEAEEK